MRRIAAAFFLIFALAIPAHARQQRCAALILDSGPNGEYTRQLLDGLYDRGIPATFLLQGSKALQSPELVSAMLADGHEIGCRGFTGENMTYMSRRTIAAEIMDFQSLLPEGYPLRLFCPPGGCSDGVRQVAQARKLAIVSWSADDSTPPEAIPDGSLILLRDRSAESVEKALQLADALLEADFHLLTVSQLAKHRSIRLVPGEIYSAFPAS